MHSGFLLGILPVDYLASECEEVSGTASELFMHALFIRGTHKLHSKAVFEFYFIFIQFIFLNYLINSNFTQVKIIANTFYKN